MAIPPKEQMTGNNTTEAQFKSGMNGIVDFLDEVDKQSLTFGTTAELKLAKAKVGQKAKTLDTGEVWEWDGSDWEDTGEGELERANENLDSRTVDIMNSTQKERIAFYTLSDLDIKYLFVSEDSKVISAILGDGTVSSNSSDFLKSKEYTDEKIGIALNDFRQKSAFYNLVDSDAKSFMISQNAKIISVIMKDGKTEFYKTNMSSDLDLNIADSEIGVSDNLLFKQGSVVKQGMPREDQDPLYTENFDSVWTNLEGYYKYYDDLMLEFPDYITKEKLGESADPFDIYAYHFTITPKTLLSGLTQEDVKPPHVIITCGVHGNERPAMYSTIIFLRNLCRNWKNSDLLADLRFGCNITVIPAVNPSGVEDTSRLTRRNIDINRNWPDGWIVSPEFGTAPFSELETQVLRDYLLTHKDSVHLDYHAGGSNDGVGYLITDIEPSHTVCLETLNSLSRWVGQSLEPTELSMLHGNFSRNAAATINKYMQSEYKQLGACLEALRAANVVGRDIYKTRRMTEMLLIMTVHAFYKLVLTLRETKNA